MQPERCKYLELSLLDTAKVAVYATNSYHQPLKLTEVAITGSINGFGDPGAAVTSHGFHVHLLFSHLIDSCVFGGDLALFLSS